jgi:hypothetical protein
MEHLVKLLRDSYDLQEDYPEKSAYWHLQKLRSEIKQLALTDVVSSAFLVQHKETLINYGLFSTREKAENYINKNTDLFGIQEVKIA